jgi:hypothetical protein
MRPDNVWLQIQIFAGGKKSKRDGVMMIKTKKGVLAGNDAFTRLEASILILAFIVVAALFTYFVAKAGIFSN